MIDLYTFTAPNGYKASWAFNRKQDVCEAVLKHCSRFSEEYWLDHDRQAALLQELYLSMVEAGR